MNAKPDSIRLIAQVGLCLALSIQLTACSIVDRIAAVDAAATPVPPAKLYPALTVTGAWNPNVVGAGVENEKGTISVTNQVLPTITGLGLVRLQDPWGGTEVTVDLGNFDAANDFGYSGSTGNGSITLTADALNYPYAGGAYPVLTSFRVDTGTSQIEYVNLKPACAAEGMFVCNGGPNCDANPNCSVQSPSSFANRTDWDQHQTPPYGYTSVNSFPMCDQSVNNWAGCPSGFNKLPSGHYYAKYILVSDHGTGVQSGSADLRVKLSIKKDTASRDSLVGGNGAVSLNVILVGSKNVNDSHTDKGKQNLNLLYGEVNSILKNSAKVSLGDIKVYEWRDADGGDYYSQMDYTAIGTLFSGGSKGVAPESEGKYVNIFMVKDIGITGVSYSIWGISGAILGPPTNGAYASGLAFSINKNITGGPGGVLSDFNPACTAMSCPRSKQEDNFLEMAATIAHEMGHYLGLNHPAEKVASITETQKNDQLSDTPTCAPRSGPAFDSLACYQDTTAQKHYSTASPATQRCSTACDAAGGGPYYVGNFKTDFHCPLTEECQFNHVMWYTTKDRSLIGSTWSEDGNLISPQSSSLVQWNSFVR